VLARRSCPNRSCSSTQSWRAWLMSNCRCPLPHTVTYRRPSRRAGGWGRRPGAGQRLWTLDAGMTHRRRTSICVHRCRGLRTGGVGRHCPRGVMMLIHRPPVPASPPVCTPSGRAGTGVRTAACGRIDVGGNDCACPRPVNHLTDMDSGGRGALPWPAAQLTTLLTQSHAYRTKGDRTSRTWHSRM
jgi:hypothetical protein